MSYLTVLRRFKRRLDQNKCDAVIVATSVDSHVGPCELARAWSGGNGGKPFTLNLHEAKQLVTSRNKRAHRWSSRKTIVTCVPFAPARRLIAHRLLDESGMVVCQYYRVLMLFLPRSLVSTTACFGKSAYTTWMRSRYVLNKPVTRVLTESFKLPWGTLPRGGSIQSMLSFADETQALYSATYESTGHEFFERGQEFYLRFVGEHATLHVFQRWLILCEKGKLPRLVRRGPRKVSEERILLDQLERALLHGEEPDSSGRDNLQTVAIVEACQRSAAERTWINTQELLDE